MRTITSMADPLTDVPAGGSWPGWLRLAALMILAGAAIALSLSLSGALAPRPAGPLALTIPVTRQVIPDGGRTRQWLAPLGPAARRQTVRLAGTWEWGESDIAFGLLVGGPADHLAVAVSPLGYVAIWRQSAGKIASFLPWQSWPHVRQAGATNEIQLDIEGDRLIVRLNREMLWQGATDMDMDQVGVLAESFGGRAEVRFESLRVFRSVTGQ